MRSEPVIRGFPRGDNLGRISSFTIGQHLARRYVLIPRVDLLVWGWTMGDLCIKFDGME